MNRPSRLIAETVSVDNLDFPDFYFELQKGDTLTGFEIIASLPIEEQRNIYIKETVIEKGSCASVRGYEAVLNRGNIILTALYTWNGERWVEGQSAKTHSRRTSKNQSERQPDEGELALRPERKKIC